MLHILHIVKYTNICILIVFHIWFFQITKSRRKKKNRETEHIPIQSYCTITIFASSVDFQWVPTGA